MIYGRNGRNLGKLYKNTEYVGTGMGYDEQLRS